jgi:Flp pilus assembly pilin Flp
MVREVVRWGREEEGQSVVEYSLLLTMMAASLVLVATFMGVSLLRVVETASMVVDGSTLWTTKLEDS